MTTYTVNPKENFSAKHDILGNSIITLDEAKKHIDWVIERWPEDAPFLFIQEVAGGYFVMKKFNPEIIQEPDTSDSIRPDQLKSFDNPYSLTPFAGNR